MLVMYANFWPENVIIDIKINVKKAQAKDKQNFECNDIKCHDLLSILEKNVEQ